MATIAQMNPTQLAAVEGFKTAKDWPGLYRYIAKGIENASALQQGLPVEGINIIPVEGGTNSKIYFWYSKAAEVNENNPSSAAAAFIRDVAYRGLQYGTNGANGATPEPGLLDFVSDGIANRLAIDILDRRGLPDFKSQLSNDISFSFQNGISLGGWGGSFYHWNDIFVHPVTKEEKTVGEWITSTPGEFDKFVAANGHAVSDNALKFPGLIAQEAFLSSLKQVGINMGTAPGSSRIDATVAYSNIVGYALTYSLSRSAGFELPLGPMLVRDAFGANKIGANNVPEYSFTNLAGADRGVLNPDSSPPDLGTTARDSAALVSASGSNSHTVTLNSGGTVSDIWLLQKQAGNVFTLEEFGKAILVNNPGITDINRVREGEVIYVPQKQTDGSVTYTYAGGATINTSANGNEYHMVVSNGEGGQTIYSRTYEEFGYRVKQVNTDTMGQVTYAFTGWQDTANSDIKSLSVYNLNGQGNYDASARVGETTVDFGAQYDAAKGEFAAHELRVIDNEIIANGGYALNGDDLRALGLDPNQPMSAQTASNLQALKPSTLATTGQSAPEVSTTDEGGGLRVRTVELGNGTTLSTKRDGDRIVSISQTVSTSLFENTTQTWKVSDDGQQVLSSTITKKYGLDGVGYQGTEVDHIERKIYKLNGSNSGVTRTLDEGATTNLQISQAAGVAQDLLGFGKTLASKAPDAYKFANGLVLLNKLTNLDATGKVINTNLGSSATVAQGALSLYQLDQAFNGSGNDLAKFSAVGNAVNFANITFNAASNGAFVSGSAAASLNTALNGGAGGLLGSGTVGALPALGLIVSIKSGDPIGIATSIGTLMQGSAFLTTNPLGWMLIGASILQTLFAEHSVPKAWGVANVSYGAGFENLHLQVNAGGDSFGTERARAGLQSTVDYLQTNVVDSYNATHSADQQVGLIAQRMPGLAWRASDAGDPGFKITEIDPLTGAQTYPYRRFDDSGVPFSSNPGAYQVDPTDPNQRGEFNQAMLMSAYNRQAIAPLWEVKTAKLQGEAGDANAGLTEEERAAKAGLSAALDTAYAASHSADANAQNKRVGSFMAVGLDLDGSNTISTQTLAQTATLNNGTGLAFDWDGQGYQKRVGGVNASDGVLVLDRDFNSSVDNGTELLSNPLVSDVAKGLRSLATWDTNGDGRIDAHDPLYQQLKVWQDFDADGNNTHVMNITDAAGVHSVLAQDESNGVKELRSLAEQGITAIDFANNRYEFDSGLRKTGVASGQISYASAQTVTLEAEQEGVRYTPVGAGIQVEATDGSSVIQITQVHSEAAIYSTMALTTAGETIGTTEAPLFEDGVSNAWNPLTQGYKTQVIDASALLANDTWHGNAGEAAGLRLSSVGNASHLHSCVLNADGNIEYQLDANFNGQAGFDYTVTAPDGATSVARVALNVSAVNDDPVISVSTAQDKPIYGYKIINYNYTYTKYRVTSGGDDIEITIPKTARGDAYYAPYTEYIAPQPIYYTYETFTSDGSHTNTILDGYTPEQYVPHTTVIATEKVNKGSVQASDIETGQSFTYAVLQDSLYGKGTVDASGNWSYLGTRPSGFAVGDLNGNGRTDYVNPDDSTFHLDGGRFTGGLNMSSNRYSPDEGSFLDPFVVRVTDSQGAYKDVTVNATHYGPPPATEVASSGGGGKPIAIDLNGDGFHFTDVDDSNVFFDVNGDGWKRRMAWTSPDDGLLVYDKNGDGKIDSFDEIGFVSYAKDQQTDLAALKAAFDSNGDGVFDARDDKWASFGVWQDANSNGQTDAGEYKTLEQMGINAVNLTSDGQFQVINGQTVHGIASAAKTDGSTFALADVTLRYTDQTQVTTTHTDGSTSTSVVDISSSQKGQDFVGTPDKDLVFGTNGSDHFATGDGDDVIVDDKGDDLVEAGVGNDIVYAGQGNDIVDAGVGDDTVYAGAGNDLALGGDGNDMLMLEDGNDVAFGGDGNDFLSGGTGNDALSGNLGDDKLFGEEGWDALFGQEGNDELYGMAGNDALYGQQGNDLLDGGAGDDAMEGGAGDDTYVVDSVNDVVTELEADGYDTVRASISYTLAADVENLTLTGAAALTGTGNAQGNLLIGNDGNNTLTAGAGDDVLDGGLGADLLVGGVGEDTYVVDNAGDVVVEAADEGVDTVRSRISTTLGANLEHLTLVGASRIDGTGNALDNVLTGNAASNVLSGVAGDDTYVLQQGGGRDTVIDSAGDADSVLIRGNLTLADISLTRNGLDVVVGIKNSNDALVLTNWFSNELGQESAGAVESIRFANETVGLDAATIHALLDNHTPTAVDDATGVQEDALTNATGNLLANDSDVDLPYDSRQHLTVSNAGTQHGTYGDLTVAADGGYSYVLNNTAANVQSLGRSAVVTDTFAYAVQDNAVDNKSATAALTVSIQGSNDGPQAVSDVAQTVEDNAILVSGNVLVNDTDVDAGDVLTVATAGTLHGTYGDLTLATDGSYSYALNNAAANVQSLAEGQQVVDSFAYSTTDGLATSNATLAVTVSGTNDAPIAFADTAAVTEDTAITATGNVLFNDTDVDQGTVLQMANAGTLQGQYGALSLGADGNFVYALNNTAVNVQSLGRNAVVTDTFAYTVQDNAQTLQLSANAALTITLQGSNDGPQAFGDIDQAVEDDATPVTGNVLLNDTDVDVGDVLAVATPGTMNGTYGGLTLAADGSYAYALNQGALNVQSLAEGQQVTDSFAYTATDGLATSSATLAVTVTGTNDAPIAFADAAAITEDTAITATGNVLANDADIDQSTVLQVTNAGTQHGTYGDLTVAADGGYTYALNNMAANVQSLGRNAVVTESFSYTVQDNALLNPLSAAAALTVSLQGTNDGPVAFSDVAQAQEDSSALVSGNVLVNDTDVDVGDVLAVATAGTQQGIYGDLTLATDGSYSYALNQRALNVQSLAEGQQVTDSFAYTTTDGLATSSTNLAVTVTGTNDAPIAFADTAAVTEDTAITATGNVLANDADIDQSTVLQVTNAGTLLGQYGALNLGADGAYTYSLNNGAENVQSLGRNAVVTDTFAYTVQDNALLNPLSATAALTVTLQGTNDGPVAYSDVAQAQEDSSALVSGNVLVNDTDVDAGDVLAVATLGTQHGTYGDLMLAADGNYSYALNQGALNVQSLAEGQQVIDSFSYTATDGLATSSATLAVTVTGTNDAPIAFADAAAVTEDSAITATGNVLANDADIDQGTVLQVANAGIQHGTYGDWTVAADGGYTYALNNGAPHVQALGVGQTVTEVFAYTVRDDGSVPLTASSTVSITITGTNDAPVVAAAIATQVARENQAFAFAVPEGTFSDVDNGDVLAYSAHIMDALGHAQDLPNWLSFDASTRSFTGTPGSTAGGSFEFEVTATDLSGASASSRFTLNISDEFAGTGANAYLITGNNYANVLNGTSLNETITGKGGADTLYGGAGNDTLTWGADTWWGDDSYARNVGSAGVAGSGEGINIAWMYRSLDTFDGGTGTDTLVGTSGDDAIVLDDGQQRIQSIERIDAGVGNDVVDLTSTRFALGDITVDGGTGSDVIWSSSGNDTLIGGSGNDVLDGGAGVDRMLGGTGHDTYYVDNTADLVLEALNEGIDLIYASASYTMAAHVEDLTLTGSADLSGTGNDLDNIITGNSGNNVLIGGAGYDMLVGQNGADTLDGGLGVDEMRGGNGNDTYVVDHKKDEVIESYRGGTDLVRSGINYSLGAHLENLALMGNATQGMGNSLDNILSANDLGNALWGESGADTLLGGAGNDILDGGKDADRMVGGAGDDTYLVRRGYGKETIQESDATAGNVDAVQFGPGIKANQLWFKQVANDLEVSVLGSDDKVTFSDWYLGNAYHVEQFKTSDGKMLLDSQVQNLVSAMAAFSPPVSGHSTLAGNYSAVLTPIIVANWQ